MIKNWHKILLICLLICSLPFVAFAKSQEPTMRIGILDKQQTVTISAKDDFVMKVPSLDRTFRFPANKQLVFSYNQGLLLLNNKPLASDNIIIAVKNKQPVTVNGNPYRGALNLLINRGITVVNRLPMEEYLYGVVPAEMPYAWHLEALKAQAVAARTFALNYQLTHDNNKGYDLCATTACQVYKGLQGENPRVNQAINSTRGQILTYNNEPIAAVFHAASGGSTINSEEGWNSPVPYLKAVLDKNEKSPYNNWSKELTSAQMQTTLQRRFPSLKQIKKIDLSAYPRNQITTKNKNIIIQDNNNKTYSINGSDFRDLFKLNSSNFTIETIYPPKNTKPVAKISTTTTVKPATPIANNVKKASKIKGNIYGNSTTPTISSNSTSKAVSITNTPATTNTMQNNLPVKFIIHGSGLGHRIGMSQWGAKGEAEAGKNYQSILEHYYTGVKLQQLYS